MKKSLAFVLAVLLVGLTITTVLAAWTFAGGAWLPLKTTDVTDYIFYEEYGYLGVTNQGATAADFWFGWYDNGNNQVDSALFYNVQPEQYVYDQSLTVASGQLRNVVVYTDPLVDLGYSAFYNTMKLNRINPAGGICGQGSENVQLDIDDTLGNGGWTYLYYRFGESDGGSITWTSWTQQVLADGQHAIIDYTSTPGKWVQQMEVAITTPYSLKANEDLVYLLGDWESCN